MHTQQLRMAQVFAQFVVPLPRVLRAKVGSERKVKGGKVGYGRKVRDKRDWLYDKDLSQES